MDVGTLVLRGVAAVGEVVYRLEDRAKRRWPRVYVPSMEQPDRFAAERIVAAARGRRSRSEPEVWLDGWEAGAKIAVDSLRFEEATRSTALGTDFADVYSGRVDEALRRHRATLDGILS